MAAVSGEGAAWAAKAMARGRTAENFILKVGKGGWIGWLSGCVD